MLYGSTSITKEDLDDVKRDIKEIQIEIQTILSILKESSNQKESKNRRDKTEKKSK